jgi:hypothetical protein
MRRRRLRSRLFWAAVLLGLLLLVAAATVASWFASATRAAGRLPSRLAAATAKRHEGRTSMRTTSVLALSAFVLGISIGSVTLASASPAANAPRTLTLIAADTGQGEVYIDAGEKGESAGDTVIFSELLYERAGARKPIGHVEVLCISTSLGAARCNGTIYLPSGKIEASGAIHFRKTFRIPVVGGTGAYSGTGGELQITELSQTRDRYVVRLAA